MAHNFSFSKTVAFSKLNEGCQDFPGAPEVKSPPFYVGDAGWIPSQGTKI